jgi:hypothetical protein
MLSKESAHLTRGHQPFGHLKQPSAADSKDLQSATLAVSRRESFGDVRYCGPGLISFHHAQWMPQEVSNSAGSVANYLVLAEAQTTKRPCPPLPTLRMRQHVHERKRQLLDIDTGKLPGI